MTPPAAPLGASLPSPGMAAVGKAKWKRISQERTIPVSTAIRARSRYCFPMTL